MTVTAPPELPQPSHDELEALIEEARRRARRRRLVIAGVVVGALAVTGILAALLWPTGDSASGGGVPEGFQAVQARGPVQHLVLETMPSRVVSIDLETGAARPAKRTVEFWYDARTRLYRAVDRIDGRARFDVVGSVTCQPTSGGQRFCLDPSPVIDLGQAPQWPLVPSRGRVVGRGTFAGRRVVWVQPLINGRPVPGCACERWGLDARTHRPIVRRTEGQPPGTTRRFVQEDEVFSVRSDVPANTIRFAVPEGGAPGSRSWPPFLPPSVTARAASLKAAQETLDRVPLWLGRSFEGHRLRRVEVGTDGTKAKTGHTLMAVPFASLDYGAFTLKEFGSALPWWWLQAPRPGRIVLDNQSIAALVRAGLLVVVEQHGEAEFRLDRAAVLRVARALRPAA
jgi:hypothetical protein